MTRVRERTRDGINNFPKSMTKQSFKKETDINTIMAKYEKTGLLAHVTEYQGYYGDLPSSVDYHDNIQAVIDAKDAFASLTASIRDRFHNEPEEFLEFVLNPENQDEINALGLGVKTTLPIGPPVASPAEGTISTSDTEKPA